ncbi:MULTISPECIES: SDR family NAD(P)-dependent oxidoreductase [unclassified Kitasatospora]|uniref:SDR family NAD(P)-dependent oxidoreductase n=1 Tax=unclassified Kitasatospora TaxID=2633591 RepID=UPI00070C47C0|nr:MULTISPECIES: SDR family NAD(P)-dependent oxidoreductase [unclassified Kitasatospora]KQV13379.1 short-chain dehydrogenase [Kitasatospora sp. Root107]KRB75173.1 short-chain dehydrogenase [Kitasatospora sp. Root187]
MSTRQLESKVIAVAGATGAAGRAVLRRLAADGATVIAAGSDARRLDEVMDATRAQVPGSRVSGQVIDLLDPQEVHDWADHLEAEHGHVDGLFHLVGGWRGSKTFFDSRIDDWDWLHDRVVRTLQHTSLAFQPALVRSAAGRYAMISATAAHKPTAGGAAYAAAKAASEAWTLSMADSFKKETTSPDGAPTAAAAILVIKALVTPEMRVEKPEAKFPGFTDTADLADTLAGLWDRPAAELNGQHLWLTAR